MSKYRGAPTALPATPSATATVSAAPSVEEQKSGAFLSNLSSSTKAKVFALFMSLGVGNAILSGCNCGDPAQNEQITGDAGSGTDKDNQKFTKVTAKCDLVKHPNNTPDCIERVPMTDCKVDATISENRQTGGTQYTVDSVTCTLKGKEQTVSLTCTEEDTKSRTNPDATGPHKETYTHEDYFGGTKECQQKGTFDQRHNWGEKDMECEFSAE